MRITDTFWPTQLGRPSKTAVYFRYVVFGRTLRTTGGVGVKATIASNAGGGFRVNYPYKNNFEELAGYFYLDPIKIKVTGEASAGIYSKALSWDYPITGYWVGDKYIVNFIHTEKTRIENQ